MPAIRLTLMSTETLARFSDTSRSTRAMELMVVIGRLALKTVKVTMILKEETRTRGILKKESPNLESSTKDVIVDGWRGGKQGGGNHQYSRQLAVEGDNSGNSLLAVVMNPMSSSPSRTKMISVARGCVWGGIRPPFGEYSTRLREMPRVLRPGTLSTLACVAANPTKLLTTTGVASPTKKKSEAVMLVSSLHGNPFTFIPVTYHCCTSS
ncbi:hypothetical protein E5676_scaffold180G00280 [Cucumis melo var. makuwa]|uniref:Uncharacterized protein n=1 Tax=Cucumis melo var. makuwa TaxID=1194695 RepID=A0A5D3BGI1_CUCMM|nr:hypothetical protein E6C27_scaffold355G001080 [Cucumis melo var. makuwa]TYJ98149.1 hypothetical protein E5676_scaffold180G00280 [Cucumis melo var. makuwa]